METKVLSLCLIILICAGAKTAIADVVVAFGYANVTADDIGSLTNDDPSVDSVQGVVGYQFMVTPEFTLTPELRYGVGLSEDTIEKDTAYETELEVNRYYGINLRGQFNIGNAYIYFAPSYISYKVEYKMIGMRSDNFEEEEFGGGVGFGYKFSEGKSVEVSYENFDDIEIFGMAFRFEL